MENESQSLRIDIVSDVVCPWCIIGYKQLEKALKSTGINATIQWHPFELNPRMADEGQNLREHLAEKYGSSQLDSESARARITAIGSGLGFTFNFTDDTRMYPTFRAHQLIHWAKTKGKGHELKLLLFGTVFTNGQNINDVETLVAEAGSLGLNEEEARTVLETQRHASDVRREQKEWTSRGIQSVPSVIFEGRHLVNGAQGVDRYTTILGQLVQGRTA